MKQSLINLGFVPSRIDEQLLIYQLENGNAMTWNNRTGMSRMYEFGVECGRIHNPTLEQITNHLKAMQ